MNPTTNTPKGEIEESLEGQQGNSNIIHILPSGSNKTLCGIEDNYNLQSTSLGITCSCKECYKIAEKLLR